MSPLLTFARRALWIVLIAAAGGAVLAWLRDRSASSTSSQAPEWPPLDPATPAPVASVGSNGAGSGVVVTAITTEAGDAATETAEPAAEPGADDASADERDTGAVAEWVLPEEDGSCPEGYPVKANENSGIYHMPGGRFYERTKAERCYASAEAAQADGYRRAKS